MMPQLHITVGILYLSYLYRKSRYCLHTRLSIPKVSNLIPVLYVTAD